MNQREREQARGRQEQTDRQEQTKKEGETKTRPRSREDKVKNVNKRTEVPETRETHKRFVSTANGLSFPATEDSVWRMGSG